MLARKINGNPQRAPPRFRLTRVAWAARGEESTALSKRIKRHASLGATMNPERAI